MTMTTTIGPTSTTAIQGSANNVRPLWSTSMFGAKCPSRSPKASRSLCSASRRRRRWAPCWASC